MGLAIVSIVYAVGTILIARNLFRLYTREPEKRLWFLSMFALWLMGPIILWLVPDGWIPTSRPGHPSWLNVTLLVLMVVAIGFASWRRPALRRRYATLIPVITVLILLQIVYPLFWQR